jgi:hypothetical protein
MRATNSHPNLILSLRIALITRCVVDLAFAWRIHQLLDASTIDLANVFAPFALVDGVAALAVAAFGFAARLPRAVVVLAASDGVLRLAAANALHFGPGIAYFPMTIVLYVGLLAAFGFAFGIAEEVAARQIEHEVGWNPLSIALAVAGVATVALAVTQLAMLHVPNALKNVLTTGIALQALTMLAIAAGAREQSHAPFYAASRPSADIGRPT